MSKLHRGWSPSPPSQRLMITVFDNINYNTIWIQMKADIFNVLLAKLEITSIYKNKLSQRQLQLYSIRNLHQKRVPQNSIGNYI